ncbi:MAG: hypothetical protein V4510_09025 [bacterium]
MARYQLAPEVKLYGGSALCVAAAAAAGFLGYIADTPFLTFLSLTFIVAAGYGFMNQKPRRKRR